jgi:hypothetical protein
MKKTLSILLSILSLSIMAQVPQGVGYQGVATDTNGIELVNQSISIRASVLSGSATGNDGNGNSSGHARIFNYNGSSWTQLGQDIDGVVNKKLILQ